MTSANDVVIKTVFDACMMPTTDVVIKTAFYAYMTPANDVVIKTVFDCRYPVVMQDADTSV